MTAPLRDRVLALADRTEGGCSPISRNLALAVARMVAEECAKSLHMTRSEAQLIAGEMTAGELRTVSAILVNRAAAIRQLAQGVG